jgi:UDPglucose 6-dehydrogenase
MNKIAVIGAGHVGLTTAVGLSHLGSYVECADIDKEKIGSLTEGRISIYEPGLEAMLKQNIDEGRLAFSADVQAAIQWADVIFIAVGTFGENGGDTDLTALFDVAQEIAEKSNADKIVVIKSTVPPGTSEKVKEIVDSFTDNKYRINIVTNPEFLREGNAVHDFLYPERIVIGLEDSCLTEVMRTIYQPLIARDVPLIVTNYRTAELIKYSANSFLAMKVTFINEIARLCDVLGADVEIIADALGKDSRIGAQYLQPGPGYGGSCLPKDTESLAHISREKKMPLPILEAVIESNQVQKQYAVQKVKGFFPDLKRISLGVLGVSFKPNTDDVRESPSIAVINQLLREGATLTLFDPQAIHHAREIWGDRVRYGKDEYETVTAKDGMIILTGWPAFQNLDFDKIYRRIKGKVIFDFRNLYNRGEMERRGFSYVALGK